MNCEEARPLITRAAEGQGEAGTPPGLAGHLATCPACRQAWEDQQVVINVLLRRPDVAVSWGFPGRVIASLETAARWLDVLNWRLWTYRLAPLAACLLVIAVLSVGRTVQVEPLEFSELVEAWVTEEGSDTRPTFTLFWQEDVTEETLLDAVLTADADEPLEGAQ